MYLSIYSISGTCRLSLFALASHRVGRGVGSHALEGRAASGRLCTLCLAEGSGLNPWVEAAIPWALRSRSGPWVGLFCTKAVSLCAQKHHKGTIRASRSSWVSVPEPGPPAGGRENGTSKRSIYKNLEGQVLLYCLSWEALGRERAAAIARDSPFLIEGVSQHGG